MFTITRKDLTQLFQVLKQKNYNIIGPTLRQEAIVYDFIERLEDLPIGWSDKQDAGQYRLIKRDDKALFGYVVGPNSWKKFLFPPMTKLFEGRKSGESFKIKENKAQKKKRAFLGVRSCELHAISIQDKIFLGGNFRDSNYQTLREDILFIAVNCTQPGGTCFCVSMGTGPKATHGYDLSLTEIIDDEQHYFVVDVGSEKGKDILMEIPHQKCNQSQVDNEKLLIELARKNMGRTMDNRNIKELLYNNLEHPQWDEVAKRCLACANCTLACPTCFCSSIEDITDLTGEHVERWRKWDSCFTAEFSYIHGGSVRQSVKGRYRQWMTHKLASWYDQFGTSGCVGCGRCITWCPVGIDITQEVNQIRENSKKLNPVKK